MLVGMKNNTWVITLFAAAAVLVAGCNQESTTAQQLEKVQSDTKQAAQDMKDYTPYSRRSFVGIMSV